MEEKLILSTLPKSWIFDLDGMILKYNEYKLDGKDRRASVFDGRTMDVAEYKLPLEPNVN